MSGSDFNYGWLEVTWDGSTQNWQILSGAYENTVNTAIAGGRRLSRCFTIPFYSFPVYRRRGAILYRRSLQLTRRRGCQVPDVN
ncbi:MAG: hypothetical protein ACO3P1_15140, partial [Pseudomonadales bacterium]